MWMISKQTQMHCWMKCFPTLINEVNPIDRKMMWSQSKRLTFRFPLLKCYLKCISIIVLCSICAFDLIAVRFGTRSIRRKSAKCDANLRQTGSLQLRLTWSRQSSPWPAVIVLKWNTKEPHTINASNNKLKHTHILYSLSISGSSHISVFHVHSMDAERILTLVLCALCFFLP